MFNIIWSGPGHPALGLICRLLLKFSADGRGKEDTDSVPVEKITTSALAVMIYCYIVGDLCVAIITFK